MGSWKEGNQYIQFVRVVYCKLSTNSKQLSVFPLEAMLGTEPRPQRWEEKVLLLFHHGLFLSNKNQAIDWNMILLFINIFKNNCKTRKF